MAEKTLPSSIKCIISWGSQNGSVGHYSTCLGINVHTRFGHLFFFVFIITISNKEICNLKTLETCFGRKIRNVYFPFNFVWPSHDDGAVGRF